MTMLPHTIVNGVPVINVNDEEVQKELGMDYATSANHVDLFVNVYRVACCSTYMIGRQAFFSMKEAYANRKRKRAMPSRYRHVLLYEGVLPLTVRQARQKRLCWGQNPALVEKAKKQWDSITLSRSSE